MQIREITKLMRFLILTAGILRLRNRTAKHYSLGPVAQNSSNQLETHQTGEQAWAINPMHRDFWEAQ